MDYDAPSMELAMGEFWQIMLPDLPELIEARTKKKPPENLTPPVVYDAFGGQWQFYMPMLHDMVMRDLSAKAWPREPIFTTDFGVVETGQGYTLSCLVYFVPNGLFENGVQPVTVKGIKPVDDAAVAAVAEQNMAALRASKSMEREKTGTDVRIEDGDMVWCSLDACIDGKLWGAGALKKSRVIVAKDRLQPAELYEAILGKGVGNHQIEFALSEKFGPLAGKVVKADLIVHAVLSYVLPDWSDELAQQFGKPTHAELLQAQQEAVRARFVEEWEAKVADAALGGLIEQVTFGPIPTEWVKMKAKERYTDLLQRARGDTRRVFGALNTTNEDTAMLRLYELSKRDAWSIITLLSYGAHVGVERAKDETLGNLSSYLQRSVRHLIDHNVVLHHE